MLNWQPQGSWFSELCNPRCISNRSVSANWNAQTRSPKRTRLSKRKKQRFSWSTTSKLICKIILFSCLPFWSIVQKLGPDLYCLIVLYHILLKYLFYVITTADELVANDTPTRTLVGACQWRRYPTSSAWTIIPAFWRSSDSPSLYHASAQSNSHTCSCEVRTMTHAKSRGGCI